MTDPQRDDQYARESFTWRRMKRWQPWTLAAVAAIFVVLGIAYMQ